MSTKAGLVAHVRWARLLAEHACVQYRRAAEHHHRHWRHHDWLDHNLRLGHHCSRHGHHRCRLGHRHHRLSLGHRHRLSYRCHSVSIVTAFWSALAATAPKLAAVSFAVPPNLLAAIAHLRKFDNAATSGDDEHGPRGSRYPVERSGQRSVLYV